MNMLHGSTARETYECGEGWHTLIDNALCLIENKIEPEQLQFIHIDQIKEKFGGLRIYLNNYINDAEEIITGAEILASITCEQCGSVKNVGLSSGGWMRTLCLHCHNKNRNNTRFKIKRLVSGSHEYILDFSNISIIGSYIEIYGSDADHSKEYWSIKYKSHRRYGKKRYQCFEKKRPSRKIRKQFNGY